MNRYVKFTCRGVLLGFAAALLGALLACGTSEPTATAPAAKQPAPTIAAATPTAPATKQPAPTIAAATPTAVTAPTAAATPTAVPAAPAPTATAAATATPAPTKAPAVPSKPQGTLTVALSEISFPAMVPSKLPVSPGGLIHRWRVYETALNWASDKPELEARLTDEWSIDPTGTIYTLKIRQGIQHHGGWGELTAEDFKWSFEDEIKEGSIHSSIGLAREAGAKVEVIDKYTFKVTIKSPNVFFFETYFGNAGGATTKFFSKKRHETLGEEKATLDLTGGTGPFKFVKWEQGNEAVIEAVPGYYGRAPQYQTVRIVEMKEAAGQIAALQSGQVDVAIVPAPLAKNVSNQAGLAVRGFGVPGSQRLYPQGQFCMKQTLDGKPLTPDPRPGYDPKKPWVGNCDDPASQENARKVRNAMSVAIDRKSMVANILSGYGQPSYLPEVSPPLLDQIFKPKWTIPYDPAKAKALIKEAGYPNGFDALLRITTGDHPLETEMGQAVAQFLTGVGINVKIEVLTYNANRPDVVARKLSDLWFRSGGGGSAEAPETVQLRRNPENAFNPGLEVEKPLQIIRKMDGLKTAAELNAARDELYDWYYHTQAIIPVVLAQQLIGVRTSKVSAWTMSSGAGSIGDFEYVEKPK